MTELEKTLKELIDNGSYWNVDESSLIAVVGPFQFQFSRYYVFNNSKNFVDSIHELKKIDFKKYMDGN